MFLMQAKIVFFLFNFMNLEDFLPKGDLSNYAGKDISLAIGKMNEDLLDYDVSDFEIAKFSEEEKTRMIEYFKDLKIKKYKLPIVGRIVESKEKQN